MPRGGHPRQVTLAGREYDPAPESTVTVIAHGFTNENQPTGNGRLHTNQNRKLGGFDGLTISIDGDRGDYEALQALSNRASAFAATVTLANGQTWAGQVKIEGDLNFDAGAGTVEISARAPVWEPI